MPDWMGQYKCVLVNILEFKCRRHLLYQKPLSNIDNIISKMFNDGHAMGALVGEGSYGHNNTSERKHSSRNGVYRL